MTDIFTKKKRSEIMSRVKGKNTKVELLVFKYLRSQKIHFQKHYSCIAGRPDIAIPSKKRAVFIDGDFWHGRDFNKTQNKLTPYWKEKIRKNVARDKKNKARMRKNGWKIIRVWESDVFKLKDKHLKNIGDFLTKRN